MPESPKHIFSHLGQQTYYLFAELWALLERPTLDGHLQVFPGLSGLLGHFTGPGRISRIAVTLWS